ncbi:MAG: cation:proton antiporter [Corynebacterium sp.]|nr:cation:proton antiporter [Corynebacterium sp.]
MVEILIILGLCMVLADVLSHTTRLPSPLALLVVGIIAALLPVVGEHIEEVHLDPEVVLSLILPFLLYYESFTISLRGIKRGLRGVLLNGTVMVIAVAMAEGLVGSWFGLSAGVALLIGAAVGPTDATAVAAMGKGIRPGAMLMLRAESLINDGTALVIFSVASHYAAHDQEITPQGVVGNFLLSFVGAAIVGLVVGFVIRQVIVRLPEVIGGLVLPLFVPYIAYFCAEEIGASGVLATVVCGLYLAQLAPRDLPSRVRMLGRPFWEVSAFLLNNLLFLLMGMQLPFVIREMTSLSIRTALIASLVLYITMLLTRYFTQEFLIRLIRLLDRRPSQRLRRTNFPERLVTTLAGFRGAISLAVALSVDPALPERDVIVFVTAGVVMTSLVVQGIALPFAIRWSNANPNEVSVARQAADEQELEQALIRVNQKVFDSIDEIAAEIGANPAVVEFQRKETELRLAALRRHEIDGEDPEVLQNDAVELRLRMIAMARDEYMAMRDRGELDDGVINVLFERLDVEEIRLRGPLRLE